MNLKFKRPPKRERERERERGRERREREREREQYTVTHFTHSALISVRDEASLIALYHVTIPNHDVMRV